MDFDMGDGQKNELLAMAIRPDALKKETKNWNLIRGYVYIISKKFRAFPNDPERLLMKIGFSDFKTDDKADDDNPKNRKDLARLAGFRTTLISFKLHRLFLFGEYQNELARGAAFDFEQQMHKIVVNKFNPPAVRITFDNEAVKGYKDRATEWFWVKNGDRGMKKLLEFIDKEAYFSTNFEPIHATRFFDNPTDENPNLEVIKPDEEFPDRPPKINSFIVVNGTVKERSELSRIGDSVQSKRQTQRQQIINENEEKKMLKKRNQAIAEENKKLEKTAAFWSKVFKNFNKGKFVDKNMGERDGRKDDGRYPNYKVSKVTKAKHLNNAPRGLFIVHYQPDVTRKELREMSPEDVTFHTDYLPLYEALDLKSFKDLKQKYMKEYLHLKKKYRYGFVDYDYAKDDN